MYFNVPVSYADRELIPTKSSAYLSSFVLVELKHGRCRQLPPAHMQTSGQAEGSVRKRDRRGALGPLRKSTQCGSPRRVVGWLTRRTGHQGTSKKQRASAGCERGNAER